MPSLIWRKTLHPEVAFDVNKTRPGTWAARQAGRPMSEVTHFIARPFDLTDSGIIAGEFVKCTSPAAAIERAKGLWQVLGHAGAVAFIRTGYPISRTTVLRTFGNVPDDLPI